MMSLKGGNSKKDRITFYDSKFSVTAIRCSDGTIQIEDAKKDNKEKKWANIVVTLLIFLGIPLLKAFGVMPFIDNESSKVYLYLIPAAIYSLIVIASIKVAISMVEEQGLKNHGAEHMVYSAYEKLKRIPTVEETKQFSRINGNCGICLFSGIITAQLIGFFVYKYAGYQISEIILFIAAMLFWNLFPFNVLGKIAQLWTTKEPDDTNIELAIAAIKGLENRHMLMENIGKFLGLLL